VVEHKGKIYVVGGQGRRHGESHGTLAVYTVADDEWSVLPAKMIVDRKFSSATVHGDQIYVLGGVDVNYNPVRSVEVYDIVTGEWSMMPRMLGRRSHFSTAVHGDNLYAVGGFHSSGHTMEVLALPSLLPWTPIRNNIFPQSFQRAVYTLMHCFARNNILPDDVLFKIMRLLLRSAFKPPSLPA
jgi:hypothetical protein